MGVLYGEETEGGYQPSWWHRFFKPAVSGNTLNGLGETEVRRPTPLYHRQDYWHPWRLVQDMFYVRILMRGIGLNILRSHWLDFKKPAPVNDKRIGHAPEDWTQRIKDYGISIGVDKVGIAKIKPEWVFDRDSISEKYVIIFATRMDYESLSHTTERNFVPAVQEVMAVYYYGHLRARKLADWLRGQGWSARGLGNPMGTALAVVPAAIEAGIGELGKHGSLICSEMGALLRLSYVLTDLPLATDTPVDLGVDDFCSRCQVCVNACPPNAIFDEKQMVRGERRWYVDFDKCVPYFNEQEGCALCLAVCPWSLPGRGQIISDKMLRRRERLE